MVVVDRGDDTRSVVGVVRDDSFVGVVVLGGDIVDQGVDNVRCGDVVVVVGVVVVVASRFDLDFDLGARFLPRTRTWSLEEEEARLVR